MKVRPFYLKQYKVIRLKPSHSALYNHMKTIRSDKATKSGSAVSEFSDAVIPSVCVQQPKMHIIQHAHNVSLNINLFTKVVWFYSVIYCTKCINATDTALFNPTVSMSC